MLGGEWVRVDTRVGGYAMLMALKVLVTVTGGVSIRWGCDRCGGSWDALFGGSLVTVAIVDASLRWWSAGAAVCRGRLLRGRVLRLFEQMSALKKLKASKHAV